MSAKLERRAKLNEGKTKMVWSTDDEKSLIIESKDDITAGNGKMHDILPGKGAWSTATTCNIFRLLNACGIPTAFQEQIGDTTFVVKSDCAMITLEVVIRREAHGSSRKRNPHLSKGHLFPQLVFELYLKTAGRKWNGHDLPCDDPMIVISDDKVSLFEPDKPLWAQKPFLEIPIEDFWAQVAGAEELDQIEEYARRVFLILEKAWQLQDQRLVDFKLEFGRSGKQIMLADVIDSDSWRKLNQAGEYSDKQVYRDGGPLAEVAAKFREAAELTGRFKIPRQQIVLWTGSDKDKATPFTAQWEELSHPSVAMTQVECSAHRKPVMAYHELQAVIQNIPDAVLIAYIGLSNGAGPMLSANCCVPTITVPATADKFPDDVWSSLRDPTSVPVMTVLKPENAILAALEILAARNPALYANLRYEQEKRLSNIIILGVDC